MLRPVPPMWIRATLCLLALLVASAANAEPGDSLWTRLLGGAGSEAFSDVIALDDGDLLAAGWSGSDTPFLAEFYAARLTSDGTILWQSSFPGATEETLFAAAPSGDGGAYLIGTSNVFTGGGSDVIVHRIDGSGDELWAQSFNLGAAMAEVAVGATRNEAGHTVITGYVLESGVDDRPFQLIHDDDGNDLLFEILPTSNGGRGFDVMSLPGGGHAISGYTHSTSGLKQPTIWVFSASGDLLTTHTLTGLDYDAEAWALTLARDGGFLIAGHADPEGTGSLRGLFARMGSDDDWLHLYGQSSTHFDDIKRIGDEAVVTGNRMGAGYDFSALTMALQPDADGTMVWEHEFNPGQGYANGTALLPVFPGTMVAVGQGVTGGYQAFVERIECSVEPVLVDAMPHHPPLAIPGAGGGFSFDVLFSNPTGEPLTGTAHAAITTPGDSLVMVAQANVLVAPESQLLVTGLDQTIPGWAPQGDYRFHVGLVRQGTLIAVDEFPFHKDGPGDGSAGNETWNLSGWDRVGRPETPTDLTPASAPAAETVDPVLPERFELHPVFPNPFNHQATVSIDLPEAADLTVRVFNTLGQQVDELHNGPVPGGRTQLTWDAAGLPSGVYFVRARSAAFGSRVEKATLQK